MRNDIQGYRGPGVNRWSDETKWTCYCPLMLRIRWFERKRWWRCNNGKLSRRFFVYQLEECREWRLGFRSMGIPWFCEARIAWLLKLQLLRWIFVALRPAICCKHSFTSALDLKISVIKVAMSWKLKMADISFVNSRYRSWIIKISFGRKFNRCIGL